MNVISPSTLASNKWVEPILNWVSIQLGSNISSIENYEIIRGESIDGCVVKLYTPQDNFYFKAVGRHMEHEPRILYLLSQISTQNVPDVIRFDDNLHWILMKEVKGYTLDQQQDSSYFKAMLTSYAQMQIYLSEHIDKFISINCPNWSLSYLQNNLDSFKSAFFNLMGYTENTITPATFDITVDKLITLINDLNKYGIPLTIGHGDFHFNNIIVTHNNTYKFIDWNEGYIGHPFYDLADFLAYVGSCQTKPTYSYDQLCRAYLDQWANYLSETDNIYQAFLLARPLAVLRYSMRCIQSDELFGDNSSESKCYLANYLKSLFKQISNYSQLAT